MCFLVLFCLLNSPEKTFSFESETALDSNHFHFIEVSYLQPASTCNPFIQDSAQEGFLQVVRNHGPCFPQKHGKAKAPSLGEILERDEARLNLKLLKENLNHNHNHNHNHDDLRNSKATSVPLKPLDPTSTADNYVTNVFLGTPKRKFTLVVDTGSDLIWTQCRPCIGRCFKQIDPIFDPSKSSSYSNITCGEPLCNQIVDTTGFPPECLSGTCVYQAQYASTLPAKGFLAKETLSLTPNDTIKGIIFGCSEFNKDIDIGKVDGIIGLGTAPFSFVQQTAKIYKRVFSYCLPSKPSETGFLKFGKAIPVSKSLKFTPLKANYDIDLVGIKLASTKLPIVFKKGSASIDSGAVISRLPPKDYSTLRKAYRKFMSNYKLVKPFEDLLDTCYYVGGRQKLRIPKMSFLFENGLEVDINPNGIALPDPSNSSVVCLPFASYTENQELMVFGSTQQQTLEVVYDVAGGKIGFGYGACK